MKSSKELSKFVGLVIFLMIADICTAEYKPWDDLSGDNWIQFLGVNVPNIYPVNAADAADVQASYPISFVQGAYDPQKDIYKARGMNALRFFNGGSIDGHFVSSAKSGSFVIGNTGDSNLFSDILILVAIGTDNLDENFSMTLNLAGNAPYTLDASDFVYYDNPAGRPSGFYSMTNPDHEPVSYAFETGMVTVYGVSGLSGLDHVIDKNNPYPYNTITIEYSFSDVPAPVVFSVYGYVATDPEPTIYHTNRSSIDVNNKSKQVSTFAVTVDGDINGDLKVDLVDLAMLAGNWLTGAE
ncbi:MAG: hypothetical protein K9M75_03825 [Phycisphaerae bacterium]|nr:hypothetical protein [Phycisphaerae bacterium]